LRATAALASFPGVVLDSSLGQTGQPAITTNPSGANNYGVAASLGKQAGGNLFFSFSQFNLATQESATFSGPGSVRNILARVTGGSASSINGTLRSEIPGANLFLMNPAGVMFGPNATLDISGSFVVTTADYVKFSDGRRFNANPGNDSVLSSAPVSAFGFLAAKPSAVGFDRSQLSAQPGAGLHVVAGDVDATGAALSAPSGALTVFSAGSPGEVPFDLATPGSGYAAVASGALGSVTFSDESVLSIDGSGGGAVVIRGGSLTMENSEISSANSGLTIGGPITVQMDSDIAINHGSRIVSSANASGAGGDVTVRSGGLLAVDGDNGIRVSSIRSRAVDGTGDAGKLSLTAEELTVDNGATIDGSSLSSGRGADMVVTANNIAITGYGHISADTFDSGNGGNIAINVLNEFSITGGAYVEVDTYSGSGDGGRLHVHAGSLTIDGAYPTGLFAESLGGTGDAGEMQLTVDGLLSLTGGGRIFADTDTSGKGGGVTIHAGSLEIVGSSLIGSTANDGSTGDAGDLRLTVTDFLSLTDGGRISTTTFSSGKGGSVIVQAGNLRIEGDSAIFSGTSSGSTGDAGDLHLTANQLLSITGGSLVSTGTLSSGKAGNISLQAGQLAITDGGKISADTFSSGRGGGITVQAGAMQVDGASRITSQAATGDAGDIRLTVDQFLSITGGSVIRGDTFGSGKGGDITIQAGRMTIDGGSSIGFTAGSGSTGNAGDIRLSVDGLFSIMGGGSILTSTYSSGKGGGVIVQAGSMNIDGPSGIISGTSQESTGDAGDIRLTVNQILSLTGGSVIAGDTFGAGKGGGVIVQAGSLTIDGASGISSRADPLSLGDGGDIRLTADQLLSIAGGSLVSVDTYARGNAGSIFLEAGNLSITGGGRISTSTYSSGKGGDLSVRAGSLSLDGVSGIVSGTSAGSTGNAGDVLVNVDQVLSLAGGSLIAGDTFGAGKGGGVTIQAGSLNLDGASAISSRADPGSTGNAGDLHLTVNQLLSITGTSAVTTGTFSSGKGGGITVQAGSLAIDGASGIISGTDSDSTGDAGDVRLTVNQRLSIAGGGVISTATLSSGKAGNLSLQTDNLSITTGARVLASSASSGAGGNITIKARALEISGVSTGQFSGIFATSEEGGSPAALYGKAGDVQIDVDRLLIRGAVNISSSTGTSAPGGDVRVSALSIVMSAKDVPLNSGQDPLVNNFGIFATSQGGTGAAGGVTLQARDIALSAGAVVSTSTFGTGRAGPIQITATNLTLDGAGSNRFTGVFAATSAGDTATMEHGGQGGTVTVQAEHLRILNGAAIASSTLGSGDAGDVNVVAATGEFSGVRSFRLFGPNTTPVLFGGLSANAEGIGSTGRGGNVNVQIGDMKMTNGSLITARTSGRGNGGSVNVVAPRLSLADGASISASTFGTGDGGNVGVFSNEITINGAGTRVSASSEPGAVGGAGSIAIHGGKVTLSNGGQISVAASATGGGNVLVSSDSRIDLSGGSSITASAAGNGGNIFIAARERVFIDHSSVIATAGTARQAGAGGNITIDPIFIILDHATISANAALGRGGNIRLQADYFFSSESVITATGSTAGTVEIVSPSLDLANGLIGLPSSVLDVSAQLREQCARRLGQDFSSFLILGRDGVEPSPEDPLADPEPPEDGRKRKSAQ
jgi:filamentous hemagglutinin family protein